MGLIKNILQKINTNKRKGHDIFSVGMPRILSIQEKNSLSKNDIGSLYDSSVPIGVCLDPAPRSFTDDVATLISKWIGNEEMKSVDAGRIVNPQPYSVSMLTSDFLPRVILVNTKKFTKNLFAQKLASLSYSDFIKSPPVTLNYEDAFRFVFSHSDYYHHGMISTTNVCNLRCRGCSYHGDDERYGFKQSKLIKTKREIDERDFYAYVDQMPPGKDLLFCPTGELFTSKNAIKYVRYACQKGLYVRILTNGMLVTEDIAREMIDLGVRCVTFSVDGHTAEINQKIRIGINFELVLQNIERLRQLRNAADGDMAINVTCGWFEEIQPLHKEIIEFWRDRNIDSIAFFAEKIDWFTTKALDNRGWGRMGGGDKEPPCFNALLTPVMATSGLIAPCTGNYQAEWSDIPMNWLMSIRDAPLSEIVKTYRRMRMDPASAYRKNCARCTGKFSCYFDSNMNVSTAMGVRFTERGIRGEAAFVKKI